VIPTGCPFPCVHDRDAPGGHDITEEGLHRDVYRDGETVRSEEVSPPISVNEGFDAAEDDLRENVEGVVRSDRQKRPVSDEEFESMPDRISSHFDRVGDLLEQETDDSDA